MKAGSVCVGIDLGTTHCALAHGDLLEDAASAPVMFPVLQVVNPGQTEALALLPSFLYLAHESELQKGALALPWNGSLDHTVGTFARVQGNRVPGRLVHSAKSWLCVPTPDGPDAAILPWQAPEGVARVSPVEAATRYLKHLVAAFDAQHGPGAMAAQPTVLTVPASFDASARELTALAARSAGITQLTLLEEPQAALYAWLAAQGEDWRKHLKPQDVLLVVDVGGGTTDFSLIKVGEDGGALALQRVAVGDHILLGGDNMDLALAHALAAALTASGKTLDAQQMAALTFACRDAKETLFSTPTLEAAPIAIAGRGASLMASTLRTQLDRAVLGQVLLDGFFPVVPATARPAKTVRTGLSTLGLPYAQDAAITRHLAQFLAKQGGSGHPTCVLFNGGVFKAPALQARLMEVLNGWLTQDGAAPARVLLGQDLDCAVAKGAAAFGRFSARGGVRIKGGTAKAYYVGVEMAAPAVPGMEPPLKALCVAPFGMEEGTTHTLPTLLGLLGGEAARFRFFSSTTRRDDVPGSEVTAWKEELEELPAIEATASGPAGQVVPVNVVSHVTTVGTLELGCVDRQGEARARFEFNARAEN